MSLDYNFTKIADWEALHEDELELLISEAIVWHTMAVGIGRITEANWKEFYARVRVIERQHGASLTVPKMVEYDVTALEPPEGTTLIEVDGELYHYEGMTTDYYDEDTDAVVIALYLHEYSFHEFRGAEKGKSVLFIPSGETIKYHAGFEKRPITAADVRRRIGLSSNVSDETRSKWTKRLMESWMREGIYQATRHAERQEQEATA